METRSPKSLQEIDRIVFYSAKQYDIDVFKDIQKQLGLKHFALDFYSQPLTEATVQYAKDSVAICCFVNDDLSAVILETLHEYGIKLIALRCAGFDRLDIQCAKRLGMKVARVPRYSPDAVAEFAVGLALSSIRKIPQAYEKCRNKNFSLCGQMGFDIKNKTVAVLGTGLIGCITARIFKNGFNCNVLCYDAFPNDSLIAEGFKYGSFDEVISDADIISLHLPLLDDTECILNKKSFNKMKQGVVIVNTSRGGLINSTDLIWALKQRIVGAAALDVYQNEQNLYFEDRSDEIVCDDEFSVLSSFPNVIMTGHQAFFTKEAVEQIGYVTLQNCESMFKQDYSSIQGNIVC